MDPDRRDQAARSLKKGSEIKPPPRCSRCQRVIRDKDAPEGLCGVSCHEAREEELSQAALRKAVLERSKGLCERCGLDAVGLRERLDTLKRFADGGSRNALNEWKALVHMLVRDGFPRSALEAPGAVLWNAAHLRARVQNGRDAPENCALWCLSCHAKDTKALSKSRAASRRPRGRFRRG